MTENQTKDLRAVALGVGVALLAYYGLAILLVLGGDASLDRPLTWMGAAAGVLAVRWAFVGNKPDHVTPANLP